MLRLQNYRTHGDESEKIYLTIDFEADSRYELETFYTELNVLLEKYNKNTSNALIAIIQTELLPFKDKPITKDLEKELSIKLNELSRYILKEN